MRAQAELLALDHSVELICVYEGARSQVQREVEKSGVSVIRCSYPGGGTRIQRLLRRRRAWRIALGLRNSEPDIIHAHVLIDGGIVAERLARRLSIPFVVTEHSHRWLEGWPLTRLPERWLARRAAQHAAAIIPVSPSLELGMRKQGIRGNFEVIPNAISTELFSPAPPDPERAFTFLHVSDFSPNKNIPDLLDAFARLHEEHPDVQLLIAGNGDKQMLREHINRTSHLRSRPIHLSGPHPPEAIAKLMRHADAFVLCSGVETQSLVLIEALLCGLPCISTRSGGPEDVLKAPANGLLVARGDQDALAAAMTRLVKQGPADFPSRQLRTNYARKEFGQVRHQLADLYRRILS